MYAGYRSVMIVCVRVGLFAHECGSMAISGDDQHSAFCMMCQRGRSESFQGSVRCGDTGLGCSRGARVDSMRTDAQKLEKRAVACEVCVCVCVCVCMYNYMIICECLYRTLMCSLVPYLMSVLLWLSSSLFARIVGRCKGLQI